MERLHSGVEKEKSNSPDRAIGEVYLGSAE